ncbi:RNA polymerase sigma factor [Dongia sedimenti]|uniref:RNA polymerase sigma factor n=1 Tax=Dongia sedimenti TaxID=3064282 RepID=A0ABU0YP96_9PROT|nr:RNA polymerase sigma factor [Rhodospirillaceae bacterium R-7]
MRRDELSGALPPGACRGAAAKRTLDRAIEAYYEDMRGAVRGRGLDPALATEVVHDLYLRLLRRPGCLDGKSSWRAFLVRAAINLGIDRMRRIAFERRLFAVLDAGADALPAVIAPIEHDLEMRRRFAQLRGVIAAMPGQCRAVFVAYHLGGLSKAEITDGLGMQRRMIDRHLRNALVFCMQRMDGFEDEA